MKIQDILQNKKLNESATSFNSAIIEFTDFIFSEVLDIRGDRELMDEMSKKLNEFLLSLEKTFPKKHSISEIDFDEMLEQLLNYSYEDKRKFDIVAALGQSEIADEELTGVTPTTINTRNKTWQDVGYYRNDKGYIEYGVIPKKNM